MNSIIHVNNLLFSQELSQEQSYLTTIRYSLLNDEYAMTRTFHSLFLLNKE